MTIVIITKDPRPDWGNKNVKRFVDSETRYISVDWQGFYCVTKDDNDNLVKTEIPPHEISNVVITYEPRKD